MTSLRLDHLVKRYGDHTAVADLNLDVGDGEFLSLLGPSGCGKTTTLQMIAGFVNPSEGAVLIDGRDLSGLAPHRREIGIVFQSYALFPHMRVGENVAFGLKMRGVGRAERERRAADMLNMVHLRGLGHRYPRELSGGQQQRVALARALVIEPKLLLLDEPMSNLDAKLREDMQIELRQLQRSLGITTVLVTHDQNEALAMSDRIALMNGGRITDIGKPYDIYERPGTVFGSSFLGKNNVFNGRISGSRNGVATLDLKGGFRCTATLPDALAASDVNVAIRPEKIELSATQEAASLSGTVVARVFLGTHWLFHIETAIGKVDVYGPNNRAPAQAEGDTVHLRWDERNVHVMAGAA